MIPAPSHNLNPGSTGRFMDPNYRTPVTEEFNGGYTWSINSKTVFEAEYVHVLSLAREQDHQPRPQYSGRSQQHHYPSRTGLPGGFFRPLDAALAAAGVPMIGQRAR